jgi:hypothetical protein
MRHNLEIQYSEILNQILNYLQRITINQNSELEKEYYSFIEQDCEKLLEIGNNAIYNIQIFEKIKIVFKILVEFLEDKELKSSLSSFRHIINDLYYNFKYIYECILFQIENEFLSELG